MQYDSVHGMAWTVVLTQRLEKLQQAKELKEQVDATRQKVVSTSSVHPAVD